METDAAALLSRMLDQFACVIVGDYFVAFQVVECWFMPHAKFFEEILVLRVTQYAGGSLRSVVSEMERLARENGCVGIQVGTYGAFDERLGQVYQKLGFKFAPAQLYKEI